METAVAKKVDSAFFLSIPAYQDELKRFLKASELNYR